MSLGARRAVIILTTTVLPGRDAESDPSTMLPPTLEFVSAGPEDIWIEARWIDLHSPSEGICARSMASPDAQPTLRRLPRSTGLVTLYCGSRTVAQVKVWFPLQRTDDRHFLRPEDYH